MILRTTVNCFTNTDRSSIRSEIDVFENKVTVYFTPDQ